MPPCLAALTAWAGVPPGFVARRMLIEVPFLLFAVFLPFVGSGERIDVLGMSLSIGGLWAAWNILAKATLGAWASILLAATTQVPDLLEGFGRLRAPRVITSIMGFMVRYLDVIVGEWARMRVALRSRAYRPRTLRQIGPLAAASGSLFIRSYERGERVYLAMLSRGYTGEMPVDRPRRPPVLRQWVGRRGNGVGGRRHRGDGMGHPMSVPTVEMQGVGFSYPDGHRALDGVDLHVHPGERVALLGPNGAGKTTLVLHLNGILTASSGTVTIAGLPVAKDSMVEIRRRVGIVFQDPDDQLFMPTVGADVAFGPANLGLQGEALAERVDAALERGGGGPPPRTGPPTTSRSASGAWWPSPPCWRWNPRSWCSTSRPPTSIRPGAGSWPRCSTACGTRCWW